MNDAGGMRVRVLLVAGIAIQSVGFLIWFVQAVHIDTVSALIYLASTPVAYAVIAWAWWKLSGSFASLAARSDLRLALRGFAVASAILAIGFIGGSQALAGGGPGGSSTAGAWIEIAGTLIATLAFWMLANRMAGYSDAAS